MLVKPPWVFIIRMVIRIAQTAQGSIQIIIGLERKGVVTYADCEFEFWYCPVGQCLHPL